jgi:DmsE family decaheme c-type cytochrome
MSVPPRREIFVLGAVCILALLSATRMAAQEVDWEAINPAFRGASLVNDPQVCQACHDDAVRAFAETPHGRAFRSERARQCESCHGPRSKHIEDPGRQLAWADLDAAAQSTVCLQCHQGGTRMSWRGGAHLTSDVSCSSCHSVMTARSERSLLARERVEATCYSCHGEVRAQMSKTSHHPVREGRVDCASCHNAHGSTPGLLRTATLNETCVSCHAEKRGPFVWEHAPVRESCANCHEPHGSSNRRLLTRKDPFMCLQCHSYGGHINLPRYNRVSNPYGSGCTNCHVSAHGSNHPSGAKLTR